MTSLPGLLMGCSTGSLHRLYNDSDGTLGQEFWGPLYTAQIIENGYRGGRVGIQSKVYAYVHLTNLFLFALFSIHLFDGRCGYHLRRVRVRGDSQWHFLLGLCISRLLLLF